LSSEVSTAPAPNDECARWGIDGLALGISLGGTSNAGEWQRSFDWVDWAERRALHSVWMPEMHFAPGVSSSPLICLAAYAARTERLRLATTSLLLPIHDPLRVAEEVAALDQLSHGRVILGLGRGFRPALFAAFGIDPASKRDRFDDSLDLLLRAWQGERVSLAGTLFELGEDDRRYEGPLPRQRPHPPLAVAAFGRKGLEQAARRGLPYLASPMEPLDLIDENLAFHRDHMPPGFDTSRRVVPVMRTLFVTEDAARARRVIEGIEGEARRAGGGMRAPKAIARAMAAPVEERVLVGGVAEVTDRLACYRERLGMNLLVARPQVMGADQAEREESLERLIEEVLPALGA
jgi:alkanesulfonate monooxygenase SsuD/methylene tetrahydromethanopterin reductase-like flavin-dependent oxidoreductase (luciferase family)